MISRRVAPGNHALQFETMIPIVTGVNEA